MSLTCRFTPDPRTYRCDEANRHFGPFAVDGVAPDVIQAPKLEPQIMRYELSDHKWSVIKPMLPNKSRVILRVDNQRVLNGIFWVLRSGAPSARSAEELRAPTDLLQSLRSLAAG
jgi:hypothetical protein